MQHLNTAFFKSDRGEQEPWLELTHYPDLVAVTEFGSDASVVSPHLHGCRLMSRRARNDGFERGFIFFFVCFVLGGGVVCAWEGSWGTWRHFPGNVHSSMCQAAEQNQPILYSTAGPA